jgi:hypothetical protein
MKESKKAQILLPSVALSAVLSMSGIASASDTEYVQTKVPGANAAQLAPSDSGDDDDGGWGGGYGDEDESGGWGGGYGDEDESGGWGGGYGEDEDEDGGWRASIEDNGSVNR